MFKTSISCICVLVFSKPSPWLQAPLYCPLVSGNTWPIQVLLQFFLTKQPQSRMFCSHGIVFWCKTVMILWIHCQFAKSDMLRVCTLRRLMINNQGTNALQYKDLIVSDRHLNRNSTVHFTAVSLFYQCCSHGFAFIYGCALIVPANLQLLASSFSHMSVCLLVAV